MGENNRSNLCKILGVDYDEVFEFGNCHYRPISNPFNNGGDWVEVKIADTGEFRKLDNEYFLPCLINHSEEIIRHKKFTQQEIEDAKTLHRLFIFSEIYRLDNGGLILRDNCGDELCIEDNQFPSIKNGESYTYEQIIGGN